MYILQLSGICKRAANQSVSFTVSDDTCASPCGMYAMCLCTVLADAPETFTVPVITPEE